MKERKKCMVCENYLISFQGFFLHPDTPCGGLKDSISIEATIQDEVLQEKFTELYGKPKISDYEMLSEYEKDLINADTALVSAKVEIDKAVKILSHPIIRFMVKLLRIRKV